MQSCHVFVMSLKSSSKTSDNSEVQKGKIPYDSFREQGKYITLKSLLIIIWIYFFQWKEILQKRVTVVIRVCYINMKAKCDMLRQKNGRGLASIYIFFFARCEEFSIFFSTLVFGVLHVWHEGELGNLVRQINERHMCVELFFFHARNHSLSSLFSSTK